MNACLFVYDPYGRGVNDCGNGHVNDHDDGATYPTVENGVC